MAEYRDNSDAGQLSLSGDLPSFDIEMFLTGDEESGFHMENDPSSPYQRENIIERKGAIDIRCSSVDVVHGQFHNRADGTLLVLQFRFDPRKLARRIASAAISLKFSGLQGKGPRPEVCAISLNNRFSMMENTQHEETTKGGDLTLGVNAFQGLQAGGSLKWKRTTRAEVSDATTVTGSIDLDGFNYGPKNCASWSLMENTTRKTGVPAFVQVGVLLKRQNNEPFQCVVEIKAHADFRSELEALFGSKPKVDPVLFDPGRKPTHNLMQYPTENLDLLDLDLVTRVTFMTLLHGVIDEQ